MDFLAALTGSFATPCAENPTVAMIEAAYRHHGIDARYLNCDVAPTDLGDAVRGAWAMGWIGFNCSLPHKVAVIDHLESLTPAARLIGAVNAVARRDDGWVGDNTDGRGFVEALRTAGVELAGAHLVLLGAGGAARAIAVESALAGAAQVTVVARDRTVADELADLVAANTAARARAEVWSGSYAVNPQADIVVNATPVGLYPDVETMPPVDLDTVRPGLVVADVIPNPPATRLLREAAARGARTVDGLGMLVGQGVLAVELWTGVRVDPAPMRARLTEIFGAG